MVIGALELPGPSKYLARHRGIGKVKSSILVDNYCKYSVWWYYFWHHWREKYKMFSRQIILQHIWLQRSIRSTLNIFWESSKKRLNFETIPNTGPISRKISHHHWIQGDPNQNLIFQIALTLKLCSCGSMLVKPKCVWKVAGFFLKDCKQTAEKCKQILKTEKNLPPLKRILALPIWGQKCIVSVLQSFVFDRI